MKKIVLLTALLVVALTLGVSAEKPYYWDDFMDIANTQYGYNQGDLSFYIRPMEFQGDHVVNNGLETDVYLNYGLSAKDELEGVAYVQNGYSHISAQLKHKLADRNGSAIAVKGGVLFVAVEDIQYMNQNVGLLFSHNMDGKLKFYNNFDFRFMHNGSIRYTLQNGLTFVINPTNAFKVKLDTNFTDLNSLSHNLKFAYRATLSDKLNYTFYVDKALLGHGRYENIVEFKPQASTKLIGNFIIHSHDYEAVNVRLEHSLSHNITLVGEIYKQVKSYGYSAVTTGVQFKF
jgi:hypothetical protein